ncbi:MAG: 23S rRNA (guanosine(2251)-2'-O)-methyltransferase RlmB [Oscillospiraceae bacterium]|nr:23S rRNA (guanosine(2251)-2'-O)-methyltransferase RlmB [Oscillospiraceae bacterium]
MLFGIQTVREALRSASMNGANSQIDCVYIAKSASSPSVMSIRALCRELSVPVKQTDRRKLDQLSEGGNHQGVAAMLAQAKYAEIDELFARAEAQSQPPFFVICAGIEDPHNLGAIARTAEGAGAHGIIIPERRGVGLTPTVARTAAGALEYIPVVRVKNIAACMEELKERGVWLFGAELEGQPYDKTDYSGAIALVIGSEGKGLGSLVKSRCDHLISLPMRGQISSLNASVAAGILLYEIAKQRGG